MHDFFQGAQGKHLPGDAFGAEFGKNFWKSGPRGFWKLERRQTFQEPTSESWKAFSSGDWATAIRLHQERLPQLVETSRKIAEHGFTVSWVRILHLVT